MLATHLTPIRWDAHGCPPFKVGADLSFLARYKNSGVDFISLNLGFDLISQAKTLALIHYYSQWILEHSDEYQLVSNVQDILDNRANNKLSIAFDLEGCNLLNGRIEMIYKFYELGVRQMLFAYNTNNYSGGGCLDNDEGLTRFGKALVKEFNTAGMLIDCSHVGFKTSMEIMDSSEYPIIFSHSNPAKLSPHPRNITDEQIQACAARNGVIGINGIGIFLGNNDVRTEKIVEHIDYVAQKIGVEYVGIGLDCVFDKEEVQDFVKNNSKTFPTQHQFDDVAVASPEQFAEIGNLLSQRGYTEHDINLILGGNFLRVANQVWK